MYALSNIFRSLKTSFPKINSNKILQEIRYNVENYCIKASEEILETKIFGLEYDNKIVSFIIFLKYLRCDDVFLLDAERSAL
jgi:uncharacterized protein YlaN (UPF0358 family)